MQVTQIHHMLHGYEQGHRQLASSIDLPREVQRTISVQSDFTGRTFVQGFDQYLTGYPLNLINCYAFAKTWYAYKAARPGCVWTHTLILNNDFLRQLPPIDELLSCFRQPWIETIDLCFYQEPIDFETFSSPLVHDDSAAGSVDTRTTFFKATSELFSGRPAPVLIESPSASLVEKLVLDLWRIQWPQLRRCFLFSTGSLSNRNLDGKQFDLQVIPKQDARQIHRAVPNATLIDSSTLNVPTDSTQWQITLWNDLKEWDTANLLIRSISSAARDFPTDRSLFPLAECYSRCAVKSPESLINSIDLLYPDATNGIHVKLAVVKTLLSSNIANPFGFDRAELARAICFRDSCMDFTDPVEKLASEFATDSPSDATLLLESILTPDVNSIGISIAKGIMSSLAEDRLVAFLQSIHDAIPVLASIVPHICTYPDAWHGSLRQQYEMLDALSHQTLLSTKESRLVVNAILANRSHHLANAVVRCLGKSSISEYLDWLNSPAGQVAAREDLESWNDELRSHQPLLVDWLSRPSLRLRFSTLTKLSTVLEPTREILDAVPPNVWLDSLDDFTTSRPYSDESRSALFLMSLVLRSPNPVFADIAAIVFETVHSVMLDRDLGHEEWTWISAELPSLGWTWNWDRAERLRQGIITRFDEYKWPSEKFVELTSNHKAWDLLIKSAKHIESGRNLLKTIRNDLVVGKISADSFKLNSILNLE